MASSKKYPFSTTQVDLSPTIRSIFLEKRKKIIDKSKLYKPNSDFYGLPNNPHITILYGIHAEHPSAKLIDIIETYPKFTIILGGISLFKGDENNNPFDVVKVNADSSDLHALNAAFKECCDFTSDYPDYKPHVTVAYVQPDTHDDLIGLPFVKGLSFVVDKIMFSGKNGVSRNIFLGQR